MTPMHDATRITFRPVAEEEFTVARAVVDAAGLPTADLAPDTVTLIGAWAGERLVATIGLEAAGTLGLLRSMAVVPDRRGTGLARALYEQALVEAHRRGYTALYCLTGTADGFFTRLGFGEVTRSDTPAAIRQTAQFSTLCSASTRVYARPLDRTALVAGRDGDAAGPVPLG
jgi:amino-acid N-acetyltransferase